MIFQAVTADRTAIATLDEEFGEEATGIDLAVLGNLVIWAGASVVMLVIMDQAGFEPALSLFLAATMFFCRLPPLLDAGGDFGGGTDCTVTAGLLRVYHRASGNLALSE